MKKIIEFIVNIALGISDLFSVISVRLIDKFEISINKSEHENKILENTIKTNEMLKKNSKKDEFKKREKIMKELVRKKIIKINELNSLSRSEYFIVIPKIYIKPNKGIRKKLFENEGFFENSVFKYFEKEGFTNLGTKWHPIYIKNREDLKKSFRKFRKLRKHLSNKLKSLIKKDNKSIKSTILKKSDDKDISEYFFDKNEKLKYEKYLFFDYALFSSLNLNEDNIISLNSEKGEEFLLKILSKEIQTITLKEIIIKKGIKSFLNEKFPKNVKKRLKNNEKSILDKLEIENFLKPINKQDMRKTLKNILGEKFDEKYLKEFMGIHDTIKDL